MSLRSFFFCVGGWCSFCWFFCGVVRSYCNLGKFWLVMKVFGNGIGVFGGFLRMGNIFLVFCFGGSICGVFGYDVSGGGEGCLKGVKGGGFCEGWVEYFECWFLEGGLRGRELGEELGKLEKRWVSFFGKVMCVGFRWCDGCVDCFRNRL